MKYTSLLLAAAVLAAPLQAQTILIGDRDCFGGRGGPGPNGCSSYGIPAIGTDDRSAGEAAATNGAQQTDFYSSNFSPLPTTFSVLFQPLAGVTSAQINYRTYGLQDDQFNPFTVTFNGVSVTNFLGFQDGASAIVDRTYFLSAAQISSVNSLGLLDISISRGNSSDAVSYDFFELEYATSTVPEPSTYALMAAGLAALGFARRRRRA